jgi:hypothetical protein
MSSLQSQHKSMHAGKARFYRRHLELSFILPFTWDSFAVHVDERTAAKERSAAITAALFSKIR